MTQPDLNITTALEAIAEGMNILQLLACTTNNLGWLDDSIPLSKLNELAQSLGYRDAQSAHTQVEHDRDMEECHAEIRQLHTRLMMLDSVEATLADCGTGGVYAEFDEPADAIAQMNDHIKELKVQLATLDAAEMLAQLVNEEAAVLLERLAFCDLPNTFGDPYASRQCTRDRKAARALAARIREAQEGQGEGK